MLKGANQGGEELLDMEVEDVTPLKAASNQHSEDRDGEH
jgi:hypothetical protein